MGKIRNGESMGFDIGFGGFRCYGRGEAMAPSSLQRNDGARPHATAERLEQIPRRSRTRRNTDRSDRDGPVELAGRRCRAWNRTPASEEACGRPGWTAAASASLAE